MSADRSLDALRREIDAIDETLHDLIIRRTTVVEQVRDLKRGHKIKIRPAREAEILYHLASRHQGMFPKRELMRMWRELIVATLSFEGPFSVAVHMPEQVSGYWDLARDQYGSFTPMTGHASVRRVIEAVRSQEATVGVLPMPGRDDAEPWWPHLAASGPDVPSIIARLPFAGPGNGRDGDLEALVICPVAQEPTGRDRSFLCFEAAREMGLDRVAATLSDAGLPATFAAVWHDAETSGNWLHLAEVDDFVATDDPRLLKALEALGRPVKTVVPLGGYATPFGPEELATAPAGDDSSPNRVPESGNRPS